MAGPTGKPSPDLKTDLTENGKHYAFFQAIRLLRYLIVKEGKGAPDSNLIRDFVRVRPNLSLAHPGTELDKIEKLPDEAPKYKITANFLGLYGESSPLPAFYTEDVINDRNENRGVLREFIDIINNPLYELFYRAWSKFRIPLKVIDENDPDYEDILMSLMGLGLDGIEEDVRNPQRLLRYIGLLTQSSKSALGLKTLLRDALEEPTLDITPCVVRKVGIPEDQRCRVGESANELGVESYLGSVVEERGGKYRVQVGPVGRERFRALMPGTRKYEDMRELEGLYLLEPLEADLEVSISPGELEDARLGGEEWTCLGVDTWLFSGRPDEQVSVVYKLR